MITNQYTYNGDGQRVQVVDSQGTTKQIWDGENILLETDGSDVTQVVYTLEPAGYGNLVSQRRGSTSSFYLFDALGSTRKLTDSSGSVTDSYDYRAYGETFASSGSTTNVFRWVGEAGYYLDIDRLAYYLRARPYSPTLARFLSGDPIGFIGSQWNLYEYINSNSVNSNDPSGLKVRPPVQQPIRTRIRRIGRHRVYPIEYPWSPPGNPLPLPIYDLPGPCIYDPRRPFPKTCWDIFFDCMLSGQEASDCWVKFKICEGRGKGEKWRCSIKARNWAVGTPCYGLIFIGEGESKEEAEGNARQA